MEYNLVRLGGRVKRSAKAGDAGRGVKVLDFALEVWSEENGRNDIFDCRVTMNSEAMADLEGYANEGEFMVIEGHLVKQTNTASSRMAGAMVDVRLTKTLVMVDRVLESEE